MKLRKPAGISSILGMCLLMASTQYSSAAHHEASPEPQVKYLVFDFMKVKGEQRSGYRETEEFFKKIHEARVARGDIVGWDLWSLKPGGDWQGAQWLTVTLYDDFEKMMGEQNFSAAAKDAYPEMSEDQLDERMAVVPTTRNVVVRLFLEIIDRTDDDYAMPVGTVASLDLMKVAPDRDSYRAYESAENEVFKPRHQRRIDNGNLASWGLMRVLSPRGTNARASHVTVNMFTGWEQIAGNRQNRSGGENNQMSASDSVLIENGIATREIVWNYFATLQDKVR